MDHGSTGDQAGHSHADDLLFGSGSRGDRRLPGAVAMSRATILDLPLSDEHFAAEARALEQSWKQPRGVMGFLSEADHKRIGMRFIITALVFFALGGVLAALMRIQLAVPENKF